MLKSTTQTMYTLTSLSLVFFPDIIQDLDKKTLGMAFFSNDTSYV